MAKYFTETEEGVVLNVRAAPRSSKPGLDGVVPAIGGEGEAIKVRLRSAPVDGKANKELIEVLASAFKISKSRVQFKSGETGKTKRVLLVGLTADDLNAFK